MLSGTFLNHRLLDYGRKRSAGRQRVLPGYPLWWEGELFLPSSFPSHSLNRQDWKERLHAFVVCVDTSFLPGCFQACLCTPPFSRHNAEHTHSRTHAEPSRFISSNIGRARECERREEGIIFLSLGIPQSTKQILNKARICLGWAHISLDLTWPPHHKYRLMQAKNG